MKCFIKVSVLLPNIPNHGTHSMAWKRWPTACRNSKYQALQELTHSALFHSLFNWIIVTGIFYFTVSQVPFSSSFTYGWPLTDSTVFNYSNIPVNSKQEWITFAITDSALLHTTLIISALHVALLRGKEFSVDAFRHQRQAVKILSARLEDPILSCLDPTILAISCLALIEVSLTYLRSKMWLKMVRFWTHRHLGQLLMWIRLWSLLTTEVGLTS